MSFNVFYLFFGGICGLWLVLVGFAGLLVGNSVFLLIEKRK